MLAFMRMLTGLWIFTFEDRADGSVDKLQYMDDIPTDELVQMIESPKKTRRKRKRKDQEIESVWKLDFTRNTTLKVPNVNQAWVDSLKRMLQ